MITKILFISVSILLLSGCGLMSPKTGSTWEIEYGEATFKHQDFTNKQGSSFEVEIEGLGKVKIKRDEVDAATPAEVALKQAAEDRSKMLDLLINTLMGVANVRGSEN